MMEFKFPFEYIFHLRNMLIKIKILMTTIGIINENTTNLVILDCLYPLRRRKDQNREL